MKDEKIGITCADALKAFSDLGEALRKEMVQPPVKDTTGPPQIDKEKENPYLRMSAYPMEDFGYTNGTPRKGDDWKILDVNCLPDGFWKEGKFKLQFLDLRFPDVANWEDKGDKLSGKIIDYILNGDFKYRYRPTPSKKTHEELAEEMRKAFSAEGEYTDEQRSFVKSVTTTHDYPENIASAQGFFLGFIAGRKSMESES